MSALKYGRSFDVINIVKKGVVSITKVNDVPIWQKINLTIEEASAYSGLGDKKIRELVKDKRCPFVLKNGNKYLIKREKFEKWIDQIEFV